jgi:hypothetical protein
MTTSVTSTTTSRVERAASGEDETAQRAVANLAKLHFEAHGFNVEWNGSLGTCLLLTLKDAS